MWMQTISRNREVDCTDLVTGSCESWRQISNPAATRPSGTDALQHDVVRVNKAKRGNHTVRSSPLHLSDDLGML